MPDMTRDEKALLLFFETCAVDRGGNVFTAHMNSEEKEIAKRWHDEGVVPWQRQKSDHMIGAHSLNVSRSDAAWSPVHQYRVSRVKRNLRPADELAIPERKPHA